MHQVQKQSGDRRALPKFLFIEASAGRASNCWEAEGKATEGQTSHYALLQQLLHQFCQEARS